jgi:hypothetical protein
VIGPVRRPLDVIRHRRELRWLGGRDKESRVIVTPYGICSGQYGLRISHAVFASQLLELPSEPHPHQHSGIWLEDDQIDDLLENRHMTFRTDIPRKPRFLTRGSMITVLGLTLLALACAEEAADSSSDLVPDSAPSMGAAVDSSSGLIPDSAPSGGAAATLTESSDTLPWVGDLSCLSEDSVESGATLRFGVVRVSSETGDLSALLYDFRRQDGIWMGLSNHAAGSWLPPDSLSGVVLIPQTGSLAFEQPETGGLFDGSIDCDSIWGQYRPSGMSSVTRRSFPRVEYEPIGDS